MGSKEGCLSSRYMTTEQREMKNCKKHICSRCGATFTCKRKCWQHMDLECPKKGSPVSEWFIESVKKP
jgi:hypothetical protein